VLVSGIAVGMLALTAHLLRDKPNIGAAALLPLVLLAPLPAVDPARVFLRLGFAYLLVAPAEEALFRGCIQSRLNLAFGCPFSTWGIRWGCGLLISSLLFGVWHLALNPSAGPQALWTFFAGLIFGIVREKSGSITAPALLHGVLNYGPQALLYDLFRAVG
jgi:membrane protease YdiL (CAAX protease family)